MTLMAQLTVQRTRTTDLEGALVSGVIRTSARKPVLQQGTPRTGAEFTQVNEHRKRRRNAAPFQRNMEMAQSWWPDREPSLKKTPYPRERLAEHNHG
jgi:hypothetical protein